MYLHYFLGKPLFSNTLVASLNSHKLRLLINEILIQLVFEEELLKVIFYEKLSWSMSLAKKVPRLCKNLSP